MYTEAELQEYLDEIRQQVCSQCVECPEGGPPCTPLGKVCGVELHLAKLVQAVQEVHSDMVAPYLANTRQKVCSTCPYLHKDCCPCPMDSLAVLVTQAIEAVDERHLRRRRGEMLIEGLPSAGRPEMDDIARIYQESTGTWTGCDWPTNFGPVYLDLNGITASEAETVSVETASLPEGGSWAAAADWLREVEARAQEAEREASLAVVAANTGAWEEAIEHARKAWSLEFHTGRTLRSDFPTWQRLYRVIAAAAREHIQDRELAAR